MEPAGKEHLLGTAGPYTVPGATWAVEWAVKGGGKS